MLPYSAEIVRLNEVGTEMLPNLICPPTSFLFIRRYLHQYFLVVSYVTHTYEQVDYLSLHLHQSGIDMVAFAFRRHKIYYI